MRQPAPGRALRWLHATTGAPGASATQNGPGAPVAVGRRERDHGLVRLSFDRSGARERPAPPGSPPGQRFGRLAREDDDDRRGVAVDRDDVIVLGQRALEPAPRATHARAIPLAPRGTRAADPDDTQVVARR